VRMVWQRDRTRRASRTASDQTSPRHWGFGWARSPALGRWIDAHDNVILSGPTGVGKSWLACALGHRACRNNRSVLYQRAPPASCRYT
jgi:hypothetical protein